MSVVSDALRSGSVLVAGALHRCSKLNLSKLSEAEMIGPCRRSDGSPTKLLLRGFDSSSDGDSLWGLKPKRDRLGGVLFQW